MRRSTVLTCLALLAGSLCAQQALDGDGFSLVLPAEWKTLPSPQGDPYAARLRGPLQGDGPMGVYVKVGPRPADPAAWLAEQRPQLRPRGDSWSRFGEHVFLCWRLPDIDREGRTWSLRQYGLLSGEKMLTFVVLAPRTLHVDQLQDLHDLLASLRCDAASEALSPRLEDDLVFSVATGGSFSAPVPYLLRQFRIAPPAGGLPGQLRVVATETGGAENLLFDGPLDGAHERTWQVEPRLVDSVRFEFRPGDVQVSFFVGLSPSDCEAFSVRKLDGLKTAVEYEAGWLQGFPGPDYLSFDSSGQLRRHYDGWGMPIVYEPAEPLPNGSFARMELRSFGPDMRRGGGDDTVLAGRYEPPAPEDPAPEDPAPEDPTDHGIAALPEAGPEDPGGAAPAAPPPPLEPIAGPEILLTEPKPELPPEATDPGATGLPADFVEAVGDPPAPLEPIPAPLEPVPADSTAETTVETPAPADPLGPVPPRFHSVKVELQEGSLSVRASFGDLEVRNGQLSFVLGMRLFDPEGAELYADPEVAAKRPFAQPGKRPAVEFQLALPPKLPAGLYTLRLELEDLRTERTAHVDMPFSVP